MSRDLAVSFVRQIKAQGLSVPKLEISTIGGLNFVAAFEETPQTIMANNATAGVDYDSDVAVTKALVEHFERKVFADGVTAGLPICARVHSDGVAAYPLSAANAKEAARDNAYGEALERYVWAKWWDDDSIGHTSQAVEESKLWSNKKIKRTLDAFKEILPVDSITLLEPSVAEMKFRVLIIFAHVKGFGFISGGAAGPFSNQSEIAVRALAELIRHGVALSRFIETKRQPATFYEERLVYFGMGEGNSLVLSKLRRTADGVLNLPSLEYDSEIESIKMKNLIATHRCLFKDQPPFVDGELERLCL